VERPNESDRSGHVTGSVPAQNEARTELQMLGAELRALAAAMHDVDAPAELSRSIAASIRTLTKTFEELPRRDYLSDRYRWSGFEDFSPVSGRANPVSPPLRMVKATDGTVTGSVVFSSAFEGPPGCVHGGALAAAFDDVLGLVQILDAPGMTGRITVHFRRPTPLGREIRFNARITSISGRKVLCSAESTTLHNDEWVVTAEADALFISLPDGFRTLAES
jgi:acyl-coenzyme A thioesterase PaaI-like protein